MSVNNEIEMAAVGECVDYVRLMHYDNLSMMQLEYVGLRKYPALKRIA